MISQCQAPPHAPLLESAMAHGNSLSGFALQLQSSAINQFSNVGHRVSKVKTQENFGGVEMVFRVPVPSQRYLGRESDRGGYQKS